MFSERDALYYVTLLSIKSIWTVNKWSTTHVYLIYTYKYKIKYKYNKSILYASFFIVYT